MLRKNILTLFSGFIISFLSYFCWGNEKTNVASEKFPEVVVQQFYTDYLTAWSEPDVQSGVENSQKSIAASTSLHLRTINSNNDSGSDYFTNVQEICPDWVRNITTKVLSNKGNSAIVELTLGKDDSESTYHINLIKKNQKWLMDSVKFENSKTDHCNDN